MVIVISMETAQQQAGSWQPIGACSGSVSRPIGEAEEGGVQGVCGPVKVNAQGGVIRTTYFLVRMRISFFRWTFRFEERDAGRLHI